MKTDWITALVVLAGTVALFLSLSLMEDPRAATFPRVVIIIMAFLGLALFVQSLLTRQRAARPTLQSDRVEDKGGTDAKKGFPFGTLFLCFFIIVIYFAVMEALGFYVSAFLFFICITFVLGKADLSLKKGFMRVGIAFLFTAVLFVLFNKILVVQTPRGLLF